MEGRFRIDGKGNFCLGKEQSCLGRGDSCLGADCLCKHSKKCRAGSATLWLCFLSGSSNHTSENVACKLSPGFARPLDGNEVADYTTYVVTRWWVVANAGVAHRFQVESMSRLSETSDDDCKPRRVLDQ